MTNVYVRGAKDISMKEDVTKILEDSSPSITQVEKPQGTLTLEFLTPKLGFQIFGTTHPVELYYSRPSKQDC